MNFSQLGHNSKLSQTIDQTCVCFESWLAMVNINMVCIKTKILLLHNQRVEWINHFEKILSCDLWSRWLTSSELLTLEYWLWGAWSMFSLGKSSLTDLYFLESMKDLQYYQFISYYFEEWLMGLVFLLIDIYSISICFVSLQMTQSGQDRATVRNIFNWFIEIFCWFSFFIRFIRVFTRDWNI